MIRKIEHIGIAVKDIDAANAIFEKLLDREHYKVEEVESEAVKTSFLLVGDSKIELLEATGTDSPVSKFIEKKGQAMHHIALDVDDIRAEMQRLRALGFELLSEEPKPGADNKLICFLHPRSTAGVLVELCQENPKPPAV
jgi:methylmalonyl-CoA/ethylmalonyl-CoA epimerase